MMEGTQAKAGHVALSLERSTGFRLSVDFEIPARGVTVLFGPSGCGKTTVLRCIAGLERAQGRVAIGEHVWQDDARGIFLPTYERRLGYVFQEASLFEHLNVEQNLNFGLKRSKSASGKKRLEEAIELLGISHLVKRRVLELSGGERQRVAIARGLAMTPDVILMDEPLAALDWSRKQEILPWLERLRDELSVPIVYVTHSVDEMARLADTLVCFANGHITQQGPLESVLPRIHLGDRQHGAAVVWSATVEAFMPQWQSLMVAGSGFRMELPDVAQKKVGDRIRVRILASDVSLMLTEPVDTSIRNVLKAKVTNIVPEGSYVNVSLDVAGNELWSRITLHSFEELGVHLGQVLWAQIKAGSVVV